MTSLGGRGHRAPRGVAVASLTLAPRVCIGNERMVGNIRLALMHNPAQGSSFDKPTDGTREAAA